MAAPRRLRLLSLTLSTLCLAGCVGPRQTVYSPAPGPAARGVVFVADGAGNFQSTSASLRQVIAEERLPLGVATVEWSHGFGRMLADQIDYANARAEGRRLAAEVVALRQARPDAEIYLVGHSAGSGVILAAAESLPPGTVDRIVLLAPAVSADYDLRPTLLSTRQTVDVFASSRDWVFLGVAPALVGTADRRWTAPAGRVGFRPCLDSPADAALYQRLRQFPWCGCYGELGNQGGHYGVHRPEFLRRCVAPLFRRECGG
jgi:pimeloyl-ACP methyl ester carboxylesterase